MYERILAILLSLPPFSGDVESPVERASRMHHTTASIMYAEAAVDWPGDRRELIGLLISIGWFESRFALHVHQGDCRPNECDRGKAVGPWQVWMKGPRRQAATGTDLSATRAAALEAARVLTRARRACGSGLGSVSLYATGATCHWDGAEERVRFAEAILSRL